MSLRLLMVLGIAPVALLAQSTSMDTAHHDHTVAAPLSDHAKSQIAIARRVAAELDTPEKARAAGYQQRFGDVPLQGEHWSNRQLVLTGSFDIEHPPILMFAPIDGSERLIGVAYAYEVKEGEPTPDGFDGAAMWHEHPALSLPGRRLVMTHVWFVDSPNGPFAHDNPTLAFLERGMVYPPAGWLDASTMRRLALTLSLARRPPLARLAGNDTRHDSLIAVLERDRGRVNGVVPQLEAARAAGDGRAYRAVATRIGAESDGIIATVKELPPDAAGRLFFARLLDEALTEHDAGAAPH